MNVLLSRTPKLRAALTWLVPAAAVAVGLTTLAAMEVEIRKVRVTARRTFENEVAAVTRVVREGARQAGLAVDLIYEHAETDLACGRKSAGASGARTPDSSPETGERETTDFGPLVVAVVGPEPTKLEGAWGGIPEWDREAFARFILAAPQGEIVETGLAKERGLYCAHWAEGALLRMHCKNLERLAEVRREVGLGRLLQRLVYGDVAHVALQDEKGIIAATPGAQLSSFSDDPFLAATLRGPEDTTRFRRLTLGSRAVVEGATPVELPDGSLAVLRVGIDAQALELVEKSLDSRRKAHFVVVGLLVLAALGIALVLLTLQRQAQRHEEAMRRRAEEQRHWQTIGQMAGMVAHEVRAPLSTIAMAAQRLRREFTVPEADRKEYEELVGFVLGQADRLERVVKDFLLLGKPLDLKIERAKAPEAIEAAVAPLRLAADRRGCRIEVEAAAVEVELDGQRFAQLLGNLVSNALDASPDGGTVRVRAFESEGMLEITVSDEGPGMDEATLRKVEQPFVSTKSHGTGLGLPLARRFAEAHGGSLELSSQPGRGTVARVRLPLRASREAP